MAWSFNYYSKKKTGIASNVTAGLDTIAIRYPNHEVALNLIKYAKVPIAAPSANFSTQISSTSANHVKNYFSSKCIILEGTVEYGLESTIVDMSDDFNIQILRHGAIPSEIIQEVLQKPIKDSNIVNKIIKAPGMMRKHYSTRTQLKIGVKKLNPNEVGLNFGDSRLFGAYNLNLSSQANLKEAAKNLYSMLHILDDYAYRFKIKSISVAPVPMIGIGVAINDRLYRASSK